MAEETISPEAQARKTIDDLKAKLDLATQAAGQSLVAIKLAEQFTKQGIPNPFALATKAAGQLNVTSETPDAEIAQAAKVFVDEWKGLLGGVTAPPTEPTVPTVTSVPSPFGGVQPNLTAPGLAPQAVPVVVGSKEYKEQGWASKSVPEQIAAMREGTLVVPEKVAITQREGNPFRS